MGRCSQSIGIVLWSSPVSMLTQYASAWIFGACQWNYQRIQMAMIAQMPNQIVNATVRASPLGSCLWQRMRMQLSLQQTVRVHVLRQAQLFVGCACWISKMGTSSEPWYADIPFIKNASTIGF